MLLRKARNLSGKTDFAVANRLSQPRESCVLIRTICPWPRVK
jgi:hypothetical protein